MSWSVGLRDNEYNRFNFHHSPSNLMAEVVRDGGGDVWDPLITEKDENGNEIEYSIGLAFTIRIGNTTLTMMPDHSKGWYIKDGNEGEETNMLDADDVVELIQLLVTLIHPETKDGKTYKGYV